jgi:ABC-type transport system substrate-binding protein
VSVDPGPLWNLVLRGGSPANWWLGYYNTPEIDAILDEAETTTDVAKRQALYKQVYEIIKEDAGAIWVWNEAVSYGIQRKYQGADLNTRGDLIFDNNEGLFWVTMSE